MGNFGSLFPGVHKFCCFDSSKGNFVFLSSHFSKKVLYKFSPLFLNVFNKFNLRKIFSILFKKSLPHFHGIFKLLFIKQKGLCFVCRRPINLYNTRFSSSRNSFNRLNLFNGLCLLHNYCTI